MFAYQRRKEQLKFNSEIFCKEKSMLWQCYYLKGIQAQIILFAENQL